LVVAIIVMYDMVIASGFLQLSVVEFIRTENSLVVALSIGLVLGVSIAPEVFSNVPQGVRILLENGIVTGGFAAVILNIILNGAKKPQNVGSEAEQRAESVG